MAKTKIEVMNDAKASKAAEHHSALWRLKAEVSFDKVEQAHDLYDRGLAAELGKWPQWLSAARCINITCAELNDVSLDDTKVDSETGRKVGAGAEAVEQWLDLILPSKWSRIAATERKGSIEKAKFTDPSEAERLKKVQQIADARRSEMRGCLLYGPTVGSAVERMINQQEENLKTLHKATLWQSAFSACRKYRERCLKRPAEEGGPAKVDPDSMVQEALAAITTSEESKPKADKSDSEKAAKAFADIQTAIRKLVDLHAIPELQAAVLRDLGLNALDAALADSIKRSVDNAVKRFHAPVTRPVVVRTDSGDMDDVHTGSGDIKPAPSPTKKGKPGKKASKPAVTIADVIDDQPDPDADDEPWDLDALNEKLADQVI